MQSLRTISTRTLVASVAATGALVAGGVVVAQATSGSGTPPPPARLDAAISTALSRPAVAGVTARIRFTNHLIDSGALPGLGSPLLAGAKGRLWASPQGVRLELQSDGGDAQIVWRGDRLTVYDATSNTVYRADLPGRATNGKGTAAKPTATDAVPTLARIDEALRGLATVASVSGARPRAIAGQGAYSVRISPKRDGGLLGAVELAWDARHGIPLRAAIYAQGTSAPVLAVEATAVTVGAVPVSDIAIAPPAGAKVVDLSSKNASAAGTKDPAPGTQDASEAAEEPLPAIPSPATLVGLPRVQDRGVDWKGSAARMLVYGRGLGAIVVIARRADPKEAATTSGPLSQLPAIAIGRLTGRELPTALGTVLTVRRGTVDYAILGSLPPSAAEAAARELLQ